MPLSLLIFSPRLFLRLRFILHDALFFAYTDDTPRFYAAAITRFRAAA